MIVVFIGNKDGIQIINTPRDSDDEAAYEAYVEGQLKRVIVVNLLEFNCTQTSSESSLIPIPKTWLDSMSLESSVRIGRPSQRFRNSHAGIIGKATVQRLRDARSDAMTDITFDSPSYSIVHRMSLIATKTWQFGID